MEIKQLTNNCNFKGLNIAKLSDYHLKKYVLPVLPELKTLGEKADVFLCSRWNMELRAPMLEYAVKPLNAKGDNNILRWTPIGTGYNTFSPNTIINKIKGLVQNINS